MRSLFPWATDDLLPEMAVREIMQPFYGVLASAQVFGWDDWTGKVAQDVLARVTPMQRGGTVHDIMISHAVELITAARFPNVEVDSKLGFTQFYFDEKVV